MKSINGLFLLLLSIALTSCKFDGNAQNNDNIDEKCNGYYGEKYAEFFNEWSLGQENEKVIDSTLYYLDKQIDCHPKDVGLIQEKANFLIYNKFYERALMEIDSISRIDPFFKIMKGTIGLKLKKENSEKLLKEARKEFSQYIEEHNDVNDIAWKIILDNYFEGKEYALNEVSRVKQSFKEDYEIANLETIEQMIRETPKKEILYNLFKIE